MSNDEKSKSKFDNIVELSTSTANTIAANDFHQKLVALFDFRHPKTGDNLILYAARCGNMCLIKLLRESYSHMLPVDYFDSCNNDGKNALHEVLSVFFLFLN